MKNNSFIDKQIDEALDRVSNQKKPMMVSYGLGPLASDHIILNQSWDYFRKRVQAIEAEWKELIQAKDGEIAVLKSQVEILKSRVLDSEEQEATIAQYQMLMQMARQEDHVEFKNKGDALKRAWEQERIIIEDELRNLEAKVKERQEALVASQTKWTQQEQAYLKKFAQFEKDISDLKEKEIKSRTLHVPLIEKSNEDITSLQLKVDLMRQEIERREVVLKEVQLEKMGYLEQVQEAQKKITDLQNQIAKGENKFDHLKIEFDLLKKENESIRSTWSREQAEWRELWERAREAFETQKKMHGK